MYRPRIGPVRPISEVVKYLPLHAPRPHLTEDQVQMQDPARWDLQFRGGPGVTRGAYQEPTMSQNPPPFEWNVTDCPDLEMVPATEHQKKMQEVIDARAKEGSKKRKVRDGCQIVFSSRKVVKVTERKVNFVLLSAGCLNIFSRQTEIGCKSIRVDR